MPEAIDAVLFGWHTANTASDLGAVLNKHNSHTREHRIEFR